MKLRPFLIIALLLLAGIAYRIGNSEADGEAAANTFQGPAVTLQAGQETEAEQRASLQAVSFTITPPDGTPSEDSIYLLIMPFTDWAWLEHIPMISNGDGTFSATAELQTGALLRYTYDRWDESDWSQFKDTREAFDAAVPIENRYLHVREALDAVTDVVAAWADLPPADGQPTGALSGIITDAATGEPVMDANLSIAGIHTASDYDGRFLISGLAPGLQRLTVHTTLGEYRTAAVEVQVMAESEAEVSVALEPAALVPFTFQVELPPDTPEEAVVRIAGNRYQLGARIGHPAIPNLPDNYVLPQMERDLGSLTATLTLDLYEGTYLEYYYTIGAVFSAFERLAEGQMVYRSQVVSARDPMVEDEVEAWRMPGENLITLRIFTPPNTTPGVPLILQAGLNAPMTQMGPYEWVAYATSFPDQEFSFRVFQGVDILTAGGQMMGQDASSDTEDGLRTFTTGNQDAEYSFTVGGWYANLAAIAPDAGDMVQVTFNLSLPPNTAVDEAIWLAGDHPNIEAGLELVRMTGNPWMASVSANLPAGEEINYRYQRGDGTISLEYSVMPAYEGQVVNDWLSAWPGDAPEASGSRPDYITGFYIPDFWTTSFRAALPSTLERIAEHAGGWVALSSVWHYGSFDPPIVEPRPLRAPSVLSLKEQIAEQAEMAHAAGLQVLLVPQFNMEMVEGGINAVCASQSDAWWFAWLEQAERFWMWNAVLAEQIGAEMLLLPGNCFHVFPPRSFFETEAGADEFEAAVADLIAQVREVYSGLILISGSTDFGFPSLADFNGVTTYDTGFPDLPVTTSVDEWTVAWDEHFGTTIDEIYARHGRPLLFYTIHAPSHSSDQDPFGEEHQARLMEGAFRALADREWLSGSFTWSYHLINAGLRADSDGVRARLGEAVLAKWYDIFTGQ